MAGIINCGYARIAAKNCVFYKNKAVTDPRSKYDVYISTFGSSCRDTFELDLYQFHRKSKDIVKIFQKWRGDDRKTYMEHFGSNKWMSIPESEKKLHCVTDCPACRHYHLQQQLLFPVKSPSLKGKLPKVFKDITNDTKVHIADEIVTSSVCYGSKSKPQRQPNNTLKNAATAIYRHVNEAFMADYGESFGDALAKVKEANLQVKKTHCQKKDARKSNQRQTKKEIEHSWRKVDCDLFLATRQSFRFVAFELS